MCLGEPSKQRTRTNNEVLKELIETTAQWSKNRGQKDINRKIVEKGKIIK